MHSGGFRLLNCSSALRIKIWSHSEAGKLLVGLLALLSPLHNAWFLFHRRRANLLQISEAAPADFISHQYCRITIKTAMLHHLLLNVIASAHLIPRWTAIGFVHHGKVIILIIWLCRFWALFFLKIFKWLFYLRHAALFVTFHGWCCRLEISGLVTGLILEKITAYTIDVHFS